MDLQIEALALCLQAARSAARHADIFCCRVSGAFAAAVLRRVADEMSPPRLNHPASGRCVHHPLMLATCTCPQGAVRPIAQPPSDSVGAGRFLMRAPYKVRQAVPVIVGLAARSQSRPAAFQPAQAGT